MPEYMEFDGPCPLLLCLATGKHKHPICPKCGGVGYGNLFCEECRNKVDIQKAISIIQFEKEGEGSTQEQIKKEENS